MTNIDKDWLNSPERCSAGVIRQGEDMPCDKPAIAVALYDGDEFEHHAFPVCKHHARGRTMYSLKDVMIAVQRLQMGHIMDLQERLDGCVERSRAARG